MKNSNKLAVIVFFALSALPFLSIYIPRALSFAPALIGASGLIYCLIIGQKPKLSKIYLIWVLAIAALCLASCFWSVNFAGSFEKTFMSVSVLLIGVALFSLCGQMQVNGLQRYYWAFPVVLALSSFIVAVDLYYNLPLYRLTRDLTYQDNISSAVMNRGIVTIIFSFFAGLYFLKAWQVDKYKKYALTGFLVCSVLVMLILTQSQSAQLAMIVGLFFYIIFPHRSKLAYIAVFAIISLLLILAPWIAIGMWNEIAVNIQFNSGFQNGYAANRMEIWEFVSQKILENQLYGFGIEATKLIGYFDHLPVFQENSSVLHPHNFALQIWIEFGLVGVTFTIFLLGFLIKQIFKGPKGKCINVQMATFSSVIAVSAVGYGIWQGWWLGLLVYLLSMCVLISRLEQNSCQIPPSLE